MEFPGIRTTVMLVIPAILMEEAKAIWFIRDVYFQDYLFTIL